jgi:hypothetical protein
MTDREATPSYTTTWDVTPKDADARKSAPHTWQSFFDNSQVRSPDPL